MPSPHNGGSGPESFADALRRSRLYAILDIDLTRAHGLDPSAVFDAWLDAGVRVVQLRAKSLPTGELLRTAATFARRARSVEARLIVNDRADVARLSGADGVHVGQDDLPPADVRRVLEADGIVGRSTHSADEFEHALSEPIDYIAIGAVFITGTKPAGHPVVGLDRLAAWAPRAAGTGRPVVAIGGITLERAADVVRAGATAVAVISDLLVGDCRRRAADFLSALQVL